MRYRHTQRKTRVEGEGYKTDKCRLGASRQESRRRLARHTKAITPVLKEQGRYASLEQIYERRWVALGVADIGKQAGVCPSSRTRLCAGGAEREESIIYHLVAPSRGSKSNTKSLGPDNGRIEAGFIVNKRPSPPHLTTQMRIRRVSFTPRAGS